MTKINQMYLSKYVHQLYSMRNFYNLDEYSSNTEPTLFVGLYDDDDIDKWNNHKGFKVLLPCYPEYLGNGVFTNGKIDMSDLNLIVYDETWEWLAISNGITNYKKVKLAWADVNVCKPVPLGDKIYIHFGGHMDWEHKHFSKEFWLDNFGDEIIYLKEWTDYYDVVENYYSKSYVQIMTSAIPLRGEATAQGLGLMGRKTFSPWPCLTPNYETYKFFAPTEEYMLTELNKKLNIEREKIGTIQTELSQKCYDYFNFSDDWMYEEYWK